MSKDEVEIHFDSKEKRDQFSELYGGNMINYHHNYEGQVRKDFAVGGGSYYAMLDRSKVKDFTVLGQDIDASDGKIVG